LALEGRAWSRYLSDDPLLLRRWRLLDMGRRRRKVVRVLKKRLPQIFLCPKCGKEAVRVALSQEEEKAIVRCGSCGLTDELPYRTPYKDVDVYCQFTDKWYGARAARKIQ
jgi:transcription elongation factor Elf1